MRCDRCEHWTVRRLTRYEDGSEITNWQAPDGLGECDKLATNTAADFGCVKFLEADNDHIVLAHKSGAPWQHSHAGPCPDCQAIGSSMNGTCGRCAGTGKVRHYDDGFIGEETTRLHPKEKELLAQGPKRCQACGKEVQLDWVACPYCGHRVYEPMAKPEVIAFRADQVQGTTDEMMGAMRAAREQKEAEGRAQVVQSGPQ